MRVLLVLIPVVLIGLLAHSAQAAGPSPPPYGARVPQQPIAPTQPVVPMGLVNANRPTPGGGADYEESDPSTGRLRLREGYLPGGCARHTQSGVYTEGRPRMGAAPESWPKFHYVDQSIGGCVPSCCGPAFSVPRGQVVWNGPCGDRYAGYCSPLPPDRVSARAEYLLWWSSSYRVPAMVTTSLAGTPPATAGVLGLPNTSVLFGGGHIGSDVHSGGRLTLDYWLDHYRLSGIEATYLGVARDTTRFAATSDDWPILARPYFDVTGGVEAAMLVAHPDFLTGSISATSSTEFQSVEVLFRRALVRGYINGIDFVVGWRFARLDESLLVMHSSRWSRAQGSIVVGTTKDVVDLLNTTSQFHGAELGLVYSERYGPWSLDLLAKLGLGNTRSEVFIDGQTITVVPGFGEAPFIGGLLAQQTNMGRESQNNFTVIPEAGVTLGYNVTYRLRLTFGYTFIYWNKVARPDGQIDRGVSQLPPEAPAGAQRPGFSLRTSDYWAQGMNFGLDYRF